MDRVRAGFKGSQAGISRRSLLAGVACGAAMSAWFPSRRARAAPAVKTMVRLRAAAGRAAVLGAGHPDTEVWRYGTVPGPELRIREGARFEAIVENSLAQETSVHWHGVRVPNTMDGVPRLTQAPISPGTTFTYEFDVPDPGTYWYHPHFRSFEQVDRGLYGAFIVEEGDAPQVDRDVVWILDDWRLLDGARISEDFGNMHDASHDGRVGNTVTLNGQVADKFRVRAGERLRLRLLNAANARIFALTFAGHSPWIIAFDGRPVEPHAPVDGRVVLGPGQRTDLIVDLVGDPGETFDVSDSFYRSLEYRLLDLVYEAGDSVRTNPLNTAVRLRPGKLPEPLVEGAERHEIAFGGGMMGRSNGAMMNGRPMTMRDMMRHGMAWSINGRAIEEHDHTPLFSLSRDSSCVLTLRNETAWYHPIHLHGHVFRVLTRNGIATPHREWRDTVLVAPEEIVEIGFLADNPGDWMIHCHILEHQATGMMGVIRVA